MLHGNTERLDIPANEAGRLLGTDGASLTSSAAPGSPVEALEPGGEGAALAPSSPRFFSFLFYLTPAKPLMLPSQDNTCTAVRGRLVGTSFEIGCITLELFHLFSKLRAT